MGGGTAAVPNPIAYSEIVVYARQHFMDVDELDSVIRELDLVWRVHEMAKLTAPSKRKTKPEPRGRTRGGAG